MLRALPQVPLSPVPDGYARLVAWGWDTVQEALALVPTPPFVELLDVTQKAAREVSDNLEGVVTLDLNGRTFKAHATGAKGGFRWRLECADFLVFIGSPRRAWSISVRYLSAGLWEHGLEALRVGVFEALRGYTTRPDDDVIRVSRADWCFDFHVPGFADSFVPAMVEGVICHSSAKANFEGAAPTPDKYSVWSRGARVETLTIGSKSGLQVQLYNKTLEITEASGKTWLRDLWAQNADGEVFERDVWRLELRWSGDFLKNRNVRRPGELAEALPQLVAETLYTRRLALPTADSNRWRWPLHPLWSLAFEHSGVGPMVPIGRKVTGRRAVLVDQAERQIAGGLRSLSVLDLGDYDAKRAELHVRRALSLIEGDPAHARKVVAARDRYSMVEDAR
jgi:hypothetical protein